MPEPSLRLYEFCPFTNKPCPAEPALRMRRRATVNMRSERYRSLEHLMLLLADICREEFTGEQSGTRLQWPDRDEPLEKAVPASFAEITSDEYDVITGGFRACMAKRCDELNPPPETA